MIKRPYPAGGELDKVRPVAGYNPEKKKKIKGHYNDRKMSEETQLHSPL